MMHTSSSRRPSSRHPDFQPFDAARAEALEDSLRDPAFHPRTDDRDAELAVIVAHFNWPGFQRPVANLLRFLREMDLAGIPVYGMEIHRAGTEPLMKRNHRWLCLEAREEHILWQKEPMLNRIARNVPEHIRFIAAVDPDIHFTNPRWAEASVRALDSTPAIQPFSEAVWAGRNGRAELTRVCSARHGLSREWSTHPGFAWAFRREFFDQVGFYVWSVTGAGDTVTATGLLDVPMFQSTENAIGRLNLDSGIADEWFDAARRFMGGERAGWVGGQVWHEWHGSRQDRQYVHRHAVMNRVDVLDHVRLNDDGILEWTESARPEDRQALASYFDTRREDG